MAGRLFGQSTRKSPGSTSRSRSWKPFDQLESRVLLSSTLLGNWAFNAVNRAGSISLDDTGAVTAGGWNTFNTTQVITAANGTITSSAALTVASSTSATPNIFFVQGVANPALDTLPFNDVALANGTVTGVGALNFAVLDSVQFSSADLTGTWGFASERFRATVSINAAGAISGSLTFNTGSTVNVTGSATIRANGTGSITLSTGDILVFTMNNSKDTLTAQAQDFGNNISVSNFTIGVRNTPGFSFTRDTIRGGWSFNANNETGHIDLGLGNNPNGVSGLVNDNGVLVTVSGSYLVSSNGSLEMELAFSNGKRESLSGRIAEGQGTILLDTPAGAPDITLLTSDVGRPARNAAVNVSGNLALFGLDKTGSLTLDGNGNVTAGSFAQGSTLQVVAPGTGSAYQIVPGTVNMVLTTQANGAGTAVVNNLAGGVNSRGDLLALNEFVTAGLLSQATSLDLLVAHTGNFANANFAGTWNIDSQDFRGSIAFNKSGAVASGAITLNDGEVFPLTGGGASIDATGVGSLNLITAASSLSLTITMASGKDIVIGNSPDGGELAILVKSSGTYAPTELAATSWRWAGIGSSGALTLNGTGGVHGKITLSNGQILNIAGSYQLKPDGSITMTITYGNGTTQTLVGRVNGARNTITLDTTGGPLPSQNSQLVVLVSDTNHAPLENPTGVLSVAAHEKTATQVTYQQVLNATGAIDREGSTLFFVINSIAAGTKLSITSNGATSNVVPGFTTIAPGDTLTYTPPAAANGQTLAFTVTASDGVLNAANPSHVFAVVSPISVVGVSASRPTVDEAQVGASAASSSILISRNGSPTTAAVTVHLSISGTATLGTHYTLQNANGSKITSLTPTVTIPAGAASVALTLTAISDHRVDPTRTAIIRVVADPAFLSPSYRVAANSSTPVSVLDGAPAITVNASQRTARVGQNGQFTISRSNTSDGPLTINFATTTTINGTRAVQGTDYILQDAAGHTLTGSITFAAGQKAFAVTVVPLNTSKVNVTLSATLAILQSNTYHAASPSLGLVQIITPTMPNV